MTEVQFGERRRKRKSLLLTRVTPVTALLVFGSIGALRLWVVESAYVEGDSMADTLRSGDRVLIIKPIALERLDIVLLEDPETGGIDIKRIVGMPGEVVSMVPGMATVGQRQVPYGSDLYINSQRYEEPYATSVIPTSVRPVKVPRGDYFVMGDNRDGSTDSRTYGPVERDRIRGVAVAVVYPFSRMQTLTAPETPAAIAVDTSR